MADEPTMPLIRCSVCKVPYEERVNLLKPGRQTWFPACKHAVEQYELNRLEG